MVKLQVNKVFIKRANYMNTFTIKDFKVKQQAAQSLTVAGLALFILVLAYFVIEPRVGIAVDSNAFAITQEIGAEISIAAVSNVTASGTLSGISGGNATGTATAVVRTNNTNGYYMDISFSDTDGDGTAMRRELGGTFLGSIKNYSTSTYNSMVTPSYGFSFASSASMFAYTVTASNTNDIGQNFLHNGSSACGVGSTTTADVCWMAPTTTAYRIIETGEPASGGATTSIKFRIYVPNNPNPALENGFYTATATLTAVNNP